MSFVGQEKTGILDEPGQNTAQSRDLHEINQYRDSAFPVGMYVVTKEKIVPRGRGYLDLHWHEELQFTLVTSGTLGIQVKGVVYRLREGDAIFINRNFRKTARTSASIFPTKCWVFLREAGWSRMMCFR